MQNKHKRILRNTGMLYMRMLLVMIVGLYTSRVVLDVLGVVDYGIYHVVAGFVALLGFMQGAMTTATQRFFAYDLGECDGRNLRSLFNSSLQIHALMATCIVILAETVGYWFVSTQLTIPNGRIDAALSAYHFSIAGFVINVVTVPFIAMLMAHERMGYFALMSISDVILKLLAVFLLQHVISDKLILYSALMLGVSLCTFAGYLIINRMLFTAVRLRWTWSGEQFRSMLGFTAWSTWGNLAAALSGHGNNILLNIFFGPSVNAGRNIAAQANGALNSFVSNVQAAINPQIFKLYASGEKAEMHKLVEKASKYNFFVLLVLSMPVLYHTEGLLSVWLVKPPAYASLFLQLTIITALIDSISRPLMTSAQATGKIRLYQTVIGSLLLCNVPISYAVLKIWPEPTLVIWTSIVLAVVAFGARLFILKRLTGMAVADYLKSVITRVLVVGVLSKVLNDFFSVENASGLVMLWSLTVSAAITMLCAYILGLSSGEKKVLGRLVAQTYRKVYQ